MSKKNPSTPVSPMTLEELDVQIALGTVPAKFKRIDLCWAEPITGPGTRTCGLCSYKIRAGESHWRSSTGGQGYMNICMECSNLNPESLRKKIRNAKLGV